MNMNKLFFKNLAYFCYFCVDSNFPTYKNLPWTQCWEVEVLIPTNVAYAHIAIEISFQEDDWDDYGVDGESLASCIFLGDNFVVNLE